MPKGAEVIVPDKPQPEGEASRPVEIVLESESCAFLTIGLFLLGTVLGGVTGASVGKGTSTTLLSSLLTFVAGAVLTFSGFRTWRGGVNPIQVSPARLGAAITALSLGVWVGLSTGVYAKIQWMTWRDEVDAAAERTANAKPHRDGQAALPNVPVPQPPSGDGAYTYNPSQVRTLAQPILLDNPCTEHSKPKAGKKGGSGPLQIESSY